MVYDIQNTQDCEADVFLLLLIVHSVTGTQQNYLTFSSDFKLTITWSGSANVCLLADNKSKVDRKSTRVNP